MSILIELFQYDFMRKALLVGVLIAISSAVLGIFLVLRKMSMIGDGLAHVSFASVALALLLNQTPLFLSIPIVMVASFLILKLNDVAQVHGDAAIGLVSSFSVALGVLISSVATGFNVDLFSYLFGSILVIKTSEVYLSIFLAAVVIGTVIFFYNDLFAITQDESFSRVIGIKTTKMNYLISAMTAITISLGIRVVGTMLISSMVIFPSITALQIARSFKETIVISAIVAVLSVFFGIVGSYIFNLPSGASIVMVNAIIFGICFLIRRWRG